jgi:hypothetical protein
VRRPNASGDRESTRSGSRAGSFGTGFYTATIEPEEYGPARVVVALRLLTPLTGTFAEIEEVVDRIAVRLNPPSG